MDWELIPNSKLYLDNVSFCLRLSEIWYMGFNPLIIIENTFDNKITPVIWITTNSEYLMYGTHFTN